MNDELDWSEELKRLRMHGNKFILSQQFRLPDYFLYSEVGVIR